MPPFEKLTTKAKQALQRSHELAMERGQDHVNVAHLLTALVFQDESPVVSVLERLDIDLIQLSETLLQIIETGQEGATTGTQSQMIQMFIAPDLGTGIRTISTNCWQFERRIISVEHLFLGILALPHSMRATIGYTSNYL
jgi:ATP-dependent Clp protease ATP-binding subunit ClpA